jgi:hypothetical protein
MATPNTMTKQGAGFSGVATLTKRTVGRMPAAMADGTTGLGRTRSTAPGNG